VSSRSMA